MYRGAWFVLAAVAWCARAGPGPPAPPFAFHHALYNLTVPENSPPRTVARAAPGDPPLGVRLPPAARVRFRIRHGDKDKFFKAEERCVGDFCFATLRTRTGHAGVLNRERRDRYRLTLRATAALPSGSRLEADTDIDLVVSDVNDLSPLFYPTEYAVTVLEDTPPHASVVRVSAEDADLGINGDIYYSFVERTDRFAVHPSSGIVTLTRVVSYSEGAEYELTVLARDRASLLTRGTEAPAARARLSVRVQRANLYAPEMRARQLPNVIENSTAEVYAIIEVKDRDEGEHGRIAAVDIVDGDPDGHFRVRATSTPGEWAVVAHALLDHARGPHGYNLTLRARDAGRPPRAAYLQLPVQQARARVSSPVFSRAVYTASVSENAPARTPLVRLKVNEREEGAARVYIEIVGGNEGGEFLVEPRSGVLYTARPLDAELKSLHTLTVAAVDQGEAGTRDQSSAKVQVTVLDANDNDPLFDITELAVTVKENEPESVIVARVVAKDADSGENAYISYSIANLKPVPFDVEHFSGVVRTTRLLDYESSRREWVVRVRASDWGVPYRRQAELRLVVKLEDINDNRPQFERVQCISYVPRRSLPGTELATLSAIDFDSGDVVSYRLISGNEDNCFSLDSGSGILSLACDLRATPQITRVLNVTATDGTHFADPTSVTLHIVDGMGTSGGLECRDEGVARRLTELLAAAERNNAPPDPVEEFPPAPSRYGENLHAPELVDFPVEVKVNESVALGTTLVHLKARDRDLGYNGLLVFAISGGDDDSAFRIDPDTGELQVIGYLDREREAEYYLNITVMDLGKPPRAASRLLPVTVLDVNDNAPRFDQNLASFRVTENALNGTAIFRAHATDTDAGIFSQITYSLSSVGAGEFCVDPAQGTLHVCAPLDRERRDLYELTILATDGGGLRSEALVRVSVDDVNDVAPRFSLPGYSARVREDVPLGTVVAVLDASDPDLGAGGKITYSLPDDQSTDDQVFTIDETSGTLQTAKSLDYEERQVYGITVRATDGGRPALYSEATLIVEVLDVNENMHTPQFSDIVLEGSVPEDAPRGTSILTAAAKDADPPGRDSRLLYYVLRGTGMAYFSIDDAGVIRTLSPLDRETTSHYWLTVCAEDHGLIPRHSCAEVYIEVSDVNDMAPWPTKPLYTAAVPEHCPAGARVADVTATDADAAPSNVTYRIVAGNPDGLFSIDESTGTITTTGRALDREASSFHALEVSASDGELSASARVQVTITDINDHAPMFTQRFYQLRAPVGTEQMMVLPQDDAAESGTADGGDGEGEGEGEGDSEDEEDGSGEEKPWDLYDEEPPAGLYFGAVLALDVDEGANGTVRYRARGRGSRVLRVHARSGRLYATAPLLVGRVYELTVRACDGGAPARCAWARVSVRGLRAGGGAHPSLPPPAPLQVAELDAPGFLLTLLQATDEDNDQLYYDIVDGDPRSEFYMGREDGSLVLARRLLWERQSFYTLNISVTDGLSTIYTSLNITVINDVNEGGLSFSQEEYVVEVGEDTRVGEPLLALRAGGAGGGAEGAGGGKVLYGLQAARAPASMALFRLQELSGVLELAQPLDRETCALHELTVWARDNAPRASQALARVAVRVHGARRRAPLWGRRLATARLPALTPQGALVATLRASPPPLLYSLAEGGGGGAFAIGEATGEVTLARPLSAQPKEYTLDVRASNPPPDTKSAILPLHITVVEPDNAPPTFTTSTIECEVEESLPAGAPLATVEATSASALRYELRGERGSAALFSLNPAAGVLATAAPLDYEQRNLYNLTVVASNMGGGFAEATVIVHVLDRNEFPPVLTKREYLGRVSESAVAGSLVSERDSPEPLVLTATDEDSPANRQRAYELLEPDAASVFSVNPETGALIVRKPLDFESQSRYEFTVKVLDMGTPRLASDSVAKVVIDVINVNDCPPKFKRKSFFSTVLLPTAHNVLVLQLTTNDADNLPGQSIKYDIIEGDESGVFRIDKTGQLVIDKPDSLSDEYTLKIRASDGEYSSTTKVKLSVRTPEPTGLVFQKTHYHGSVVENTTKPSTVAVLNVLGTVLNEHVEFRILNPVEGFQMGLTSGAVTAGGIPLDRETVAKYTLLIEARSTGSGDIDSRVARSKLHVSVVDVNDNCPVFVERPYVAAVRAGDLAGTQLIQVHAVDADENDNGEVRYEMKRGNGELFRVDRRTGVISLKQTLDAHNQLYELIVAAFDGGVPPCGVEAAVRVRVWAGGAAPSWPRAHYALSVREDVAVGAPLAPALLAESPLQRQLIYTLLNPEEHPQFELNFDTAHDRGHSPCVILIASELDYERAASHTLAVRASDGVTGAHADVTVTVRVRDVNDNAPEFRQQLYVAAVSEAAAPGTLVLNVHAQDNDTGLNGEIVYSISSLDNTSSPLSVDGSGAVVLSRALDRERVALHRLLLTTTDRGVPPLQATALLLLTVEDVNDNPPKLERTVLSVAVSAEAGRGTAVGAVSAWDPDWRDAARLHYALAAPSPRAFSIDPRSGVIRLAEPAAWRASAPLALNVSVSDGAHAAFARVKLAVAPSNTAPPRFLHALHEARALENQPPPLLLTTVRAYDDDSGEYGSVSYSIPSALLRETFAVDPRSGALTTRKPLDREAKAEWLVPITAGDGGGLLQHTTVRVRVTDVNDNQPIFPHRDYRATIRSDLASLSPFFTITAYDADEGDNAKITYSIYEGEDVQVKSDTQGLFHVDAKSGALSLAKNASQFAGQTIRIWVRASDGPTGTGQTSEAPVSICIAGGVASSPAPPPGPPTDLFLPEDAEPGTLITQLQTAGDVKYELSRGLWPRDLFAIDRTGRLLLAATLDRETAPLHRIGIIVESAASPASYLVQVALHVLDVNEHASQFHSQPYLVRLAENTPPGASVVQIVAEDADAGSNGEVRYSLSEESESRELFTVDPYTGWVTTAASLDRETRPEHRLVLRATDGGAGRLATRGSLIVRLVDYNDCPPKFQNELYTASVREDAPAGTVVLTLQVTDPDLVTSPLSYHISDGDATSRFGIRPSGEVFIARPLDRETTPRYELEVFVTDGKFTANTKVHVEVLDANDNPPYCVQHRYHARLPESAPPGSAALAVLTRDDDEPQNARLRFYITGEDAMDFAIHKEDGLVTIANSLDRERRAFYRLQAHAQDRARPSWECVSELLITIDDVNDNPPKFSAARYSLTLPEDAELGSLITKVHATDADRGANRLLRYSLLGDPSTAAAFRLDASTGILTLGAPLDRETTSSHRLTVLAQDGGEPSLSATAEVLLTVADVNDNPPEFEFQTYTASVPELDAVGTEVLRIMATSKDTGVNADVYYSIVGGDARDDFVIDRTTGVVNIARPLDYERIKEYILTVQAMDGGTPPLSDHATLNITVIDCNDNAPLFALSSYGERVKEDSPVGSRVLQVIALDADAGENGRVQYSIARGDSDGKFAIDADTGYISLLSPLDRETVPAYALEVRARDRGIPQLQTSATVNLEVMDVNDNPPQFSSNNFTCMVQEGRPLGYALLELQVTDADASPNAAPFTFDFQTGNEGGAFRLEQDGVLRTATRFNHRIKDEYVLQVRVFDNGTPPLFTDARVTVRVVEQSQFPPVVTPLEVVVMSHRDEFPGGRLARVAASDRDPWDVLHYALLESPAPSVARGLFTVDARSGDLRAAPRLDPGEYRLNVTVSDGRFVAAAPVRVSVRLVGPDALAHAVAVRFREVTDTAFILSHRKGFIRAVSEAVNCSPSNVVIISVQPSGDGANELSRMRRQVAQDLDVLFAVSSSDGWMSADTLRRALHANIERLEESCRLVVEELVRAACGGCGRGTCGERAELLPGTRSVESDVFALVAPAHRLAGACVCEAGYGGPRCEAALPAAGTDEILAHFAGDSYALYRLEKGVVNGERLLEDELILEIRIRTLAPRGTLVAAGTTPGRGDYLILEIVEGFVQLRMDLGGGEATARAETLVSDGSWHSVRLERRGGAVRLAVGGGHAAQAQAPPPAAVLDAPDPLLYVGAQLIRHAHANAAPQISYGFVGCISELRLGSTLLPLQEGGAMARAQLQRAVRVRVLRVQTGAGASCPPLPSPGACASYPCSNGGTCVESPAAAADGASSGYRCTCHARYTGARCERDLAPCAGRPCLHGGLCARAASPRGYSCECVPPARGDRCERGRYCTQDGVCGSRGSCEEGAWGPSCRCHGYYGPLCQHDVDECAGEPCAEGATCLNQPGSFRCLCQPGRTGASCGDPLTSGAVLSADSITSTPSLIWTWIRGAGWPVYVGGAFLIFLLLLLALLPILCWTNRRRDSSPVKDVPLNSQIEKLPTKLSNLAADRRERPTSCACEPAPRALNNADTLRSYGSAGEELEGMPADYLRNLNIEPSDRKPWSEQMHLHTFTDNKIYNDLKGSKSPGPSSPASSAPNVAGLRAARCPDGVPVGAGGVPGVAGAGGGDLVGGYHWDCSDWCGGAGTLPAITEVTAGERRDSTSPSSVGRAPLLYPPPPYDTSSGIDDDDHRYDFTDASTYLMHPDVYLPPAVSAGEGTAGEGVGEEMGDNMLRALRLREPDAASLITMLEERNSLLGGADHCSSLSDVSMRLCEIEESDTEEPSATAAAAACRHTDV